MRELCNPEECNCDYSWSDCDLTNSITKAESQLREQIAQEIEADTTVLVIARELLGGNAVVHPNIKTHYANIARGK